ncbi:MAG: helix-turn-helix transcriptional regulator [Elusimicrobiota bacterium]|jgi:transcriptional regulator with XRE-family HTH domain
MSGESGAFSGGFSRRVAEGMADRGVGLRELCRAVGLDPSFFSKVLSGKRSPPAQESVLRQIASFLGLDPVGLVVSAGRIPSEWRLLVEDPETLRSAHSLITGSPGRTQRIVASAKPRANRPPSETRRGGLSDELL